MDTAEKLEYISNYDPAGADKLKRLLDRKDALKTGNVYGERFTDRQFSLVFEPLLKMSLEKARILETLLSWEETIRGLSERLGLKEDVVFRHLKDMVKGNLVEIAGHKGRDALFRKKVD
jgi:DNA-binding MarR family transcriptional regulator